jgi:tetratricopeptide (TPR) repeat protein
MALFFSGARLISAQPVQTGDGEPAWLSLERGKRAFGDKDFGEAIMQFDSAIAVRRSIFTTAAARLDQALEAKAAVKAGDSIKNVLTAFASEDFLQRDYARLTAGRSTSSKTFLESLRRERISDSHRAFIEVLLLVLDYRPMEAMNDSISTLRNRVRLLITYPEAEYWKGRVFFVEGELSLAELQYKRAYSMIPALEIPDDLYTILYSMAELYDAHSDFVAWENVMKGIVDSNDKDIDAFLREAMMATLLDDGFNRFMTLYRLKPSYSLDANAALASFYLERGRAPALMHAAVAVNMTLTRAIAMMELKDRNYTWKSLEDFLKTATLRKDVSMHLQEAGLPRLLLTLADSLYIAGGRNAATMLWNAVTALETAPYSAVALARLANPTSAVRRAVP